MRIARIARLSHMLGFFPNMVTYEVATSDTGNTNHFQPALWFLMLPNGNVILDY